MKAIILEKYLGKDIVFTHDGWINATQVTKTLGKKGLDNFMRSKQLDGYKKAIRKIYGSPEDELIRTVKGGDVREQEQGTYLHPKLVVTFARWISPEFAVKCDQIIYGLLTEELQLRYNNLKKDYDRLEQKADDQYELMLLLEHPDEQSSEYLRNAINANEKVSDMILEKINMNLSIGKKVSTIIINGEAFMRLIDEMNEVEAEVLKASAIARRFGDTPCYSYEGYNLIVNTRDVQPGQIILI